jgi:predicted dinucleotide-binding enzyme
MHIAIIGAGHVGMTLARRFVAAGHTVAFGLRNPSAEPAPDFPAALRDIPSACTDADLVLLAVPFAAVPDALAAAGDLGTRIIVDATNPVGPGLTLAVGGQDSGAERVARLAPAACVVKCFNTVGVEVMADPAFGDARALMLACGDDAEAVNTVVALANAIGFDARAFGGLAQARLLEPMALVWIRLAMIHDQGRQHALVHHRRG